MLLPRRASTIVRAATALAFAIAIAGAAAKSCSTDDDCGSQTCVAKQCVASGECDKDVDCGAWSCISGYCGGAEGDPCRKDTDCRTVSVGDVLTEVLTGKRPICSSSGVCSGEDDEPVTTAAPSTVEATTADQSTTSAGSDDICAGDRDCPTGRLCEDGECLGGIGASCDADSPCWGLFQCRSNVCESLIDPNPSPKPEPGPTASSNLLSVVTKLVACGGGSESEGVSLSDGLFRKIVSTLLLLIPVVPFIYTRLLKKMDRAGKRFSIISKACIAILFVAFITICALSGVSFRRRVQSSQDYADFFEDFRDCIQSAAPPANPDNSSIMSGTYIKAAGILFVAVTSALAVLAEVAFLYWLSQKMGADDEIDSVPKRRKYIYIPLAAAFLAGISLAIAYFVNRSVLNSAKSYRITGCTRSGPASGSFLICEPAEMVAEDFSLPRFSAACATLEAASASAGREKCTDYDATVARLRGAGAGAQAAREDALLLLAVRVLAFPKLARNLAAQPIDAAVLAAVVCIGLLSLALVFLSALLLVRRTHRAAVWAALGAYVALAWAQSGLEAARAGRFEANLLVFTATNCGCAPSETETQNFVSIQPYLGSFYFVVTTYVLPCFFAALAMASMFTEGRYEEFDEGKMGDEEGAVGLSGQGA